MNFIRTVLNKAGVLESLKYSALGNLYFSIFKPSKKRAFIRELDFYRSFLPGCELIFDIGANDGHKTVVFAELASTVIACDPDPYNIKILNTRFRNNPRIRIEPVAISDQTGESNLYIERSGSALNSINPQWKIILEEKNNNRWTEPIKFSDSVIAVPTTTLDALIQKHGVPDFIKIDVEGSEKNVLLGLSHPVKYISYEVLLPEFLQDAIDCIDLLLKNNPGAVFNFSVDEKLQLPEFTDHHTFRNLLQNLSIPHLEIIAATG